MKRKILAAIILVVMLMSSFTFAASAASPQVPSLQSFIDGITRTPGYSYITTYYLPVNSNVAVSYATVIPANIQVSIMTGYTLYVDALLTVYGKLNVAPTQVIYGPNGSISNQTTPQNYTCPYHLTSYIKCSMCGVTYCPSCVGGYHTRNSATDQCTIYRNDNAVCGIHGTSKLFCAHCNVYYCQQCVGGTHLYNPATKTCGIYSGGSSTQYFCSYHRSTYLIYCSNCKTYYCPTCSGGYHVYNPVTKTCGISGGGSQTDIYCTTHTSTKLLYCNYCNTYYCQACIGGYHVYNASTGLCSISQNTVAYCSVHGTLKTYCSDCKTYYCPTCSGGYHVYDPVAKKCVVYSNNGYYPGFYDWYFDYIWIPGYGYVARNTTAEKPTASLASGSVIDEGTQITLSSRTPGAVIYYTLDGTAPTTKSYRYTEPIKIYKNTTIQAVAIHPYLYTSGVGVFKYTLKPSPANTFKDITNYPGLSVSLNLLIANKVIAATSTFDPTGTVSLDTLKSWFKAIGIIADKSIDDIEVGDKSKLTYEELILISYKIMRSDKIINTPKKQGSELLKKLTNLDEITDKAAYKAAYSAMIEYKVLYGYDFKPQAEANRVYLATIVAWAINNK